MYNAGGIVSAERVRGVRRPRDVSEWVEDCWNEDYVGAPSDGSAWGTGDCQRRALRGGSWESGPEDVRAATRSWAIPDLRLTDYGLRVARTLSP